MNKLKTLKELYNPKFADECSPDLEDFIPSLKKEAIKLFKNLQTGKSIYPIILNKFPEDCKGECAKEIVRNSC